MTELRSATCVALAKISGDMGDAMAIRHDCVRSAFKSWTFLQMRVFNDANNFPWELARGDIKEILTLLKQNPNERRRWRMYDEHPWLRAKR